VRRIAILEGHPVAAIGLKVLINAAAGLELSGLHTDGGSLFSSIQKQPVEAVAIDLDVSHGRLHGPGLIELLRAAFPNLDIIIVGGVDAATRRECFKAGATAVLDKANDCSVLLAHLSGSPSTLTD
jgi:DNA-binding NarL/FixJ family response regulator